MNNPLISVIVPIYNVEKYLDRCVESIINQSYHNLEIILVDDGSPDNCPEKCDRWATIDKRIKVIHKENGGLSSARNAGLDACTGVYISFVDSDDWIEPTMLQSMMDTCLQNNVKLAVCGRYVDWGESGLRQLGKCPTKNEVVDSRTFVARMLIAKECDSSACDKLYHNSLWRHVRFPEGKIYEDVAVMYKVVLSTPSVVTLDIPLYNYFRHANSITTSKFSPKLFDYPDNVRQVLEDIESHYPDLLDYACWAHMKAIEYVLDKIYSSNRRDCNKNSVEAKKLSSEVYSYRKIWSKSTVFNSRDKILCWVFSRWYIAKPAMKIKKVIKKMRQYLK